MKANSGSATADKDGARFVDRHKPRILLAAVQLAPMKAINRFRRRAGRFLRLFG
jgi:hypothetical protein